MLDGVRDLCIPCDIAVCLSIWLYLPVGLTLVVCMYVPIYNKDIYYYYILLF